MAEVAVDERVPSVGIDIAAIGGAAALDAFARSVADVFALGLPPGSAACDFAVAITSWHLGTIMVGSFAASAMTFDRSPELLAAGGLDHLLVQLYGEGGFTGTAGARPVTVGPGDIVVFDLLDTVHTRASAYRNISLLIPRTSIAADIDWPALHGTVVPERDPLGALLGGYMRGLVERLKRLGQREALAAAQATAGLAGTILGQRAGHETARPAGAAPLLLRASRHIDARLGNCALDADALAVALGTSRASLYRAFGEAGGVARFIRRRRLVKAAIALASPAHRHKRIGEIATAHGFGSTTTFNRLFRETFGLSPSEAREQNRLPTGPDGGGAPLAADQRFATWIRTLHGVTPPAPAAAES